jgi:uncharacterized repeat protein (TIGR01451 family)
VTDGDPTAFNDPHPNDTGDIQLSDVTTNASRDGNALSYAVAHADEVKDQGSHMLVVGVGLGLQNAASMARLEDISGPDVFTGSPDTFDVQNDDVTLVADFDDLEAALREIAFQLCGSSVNVTKRVDGVLAPGFEFTAEVGSPPPSGTDYTWVSPDPGAAAGDPVTAATDANGNLTFQWDLTAPVASGVTVTETVRPGFAFVDLACEVKNIEDPDPQPLAVSQSGASFDATLGPTDIVTCEFNNRRLEPAIELQKTVYVGHDGGASCPGTELVTGALGTPVTYCFGVTNGGETHLAAVSVQDSALVDAITPGLAIDKSPDSQAVVTGGTASFTIGVTNTGDVGLTNVVVSDPQAPDCDRTFASLPFGASETYSCTAPVTSGFTNVATVTGDDPNGDPAPPDQDDALVEALFPAIAIDKSPDAQRVVVGRSALFTIEVSNVGQVELTNVVVTDPLAPDCERSFAAITAGNSQSYSCAAQVLADFTNVAFASCEDPAGGLVGPASDEAPVTAITPGLAIEKSPDDQEVVISNDAGFTIEVTNTGDVPLSNVVVSDPLAPDCDRSFPLLDVGAREIYTCQVTVDADFVNVAEASGSDPNGDPVGPVSDEANVVAVPPPVIAPPIPAASRFGLAALALLLALAMALALRVRRS